MCNKLLPLLTVFLLSTSLFATTATIVLKSGERIERAVIVPEASSAVLNVHGRGWVRQIAARDILTVTDDSGRDITKDILKSLAPQGAADTLTYLSADSVAVLQSNALMRKKPYLIGLCAAGFLNAPTGSFYSDLSSAAGFGADVRIPVSRCVAVKLSALRGGAVQDRGHFALTRGFFALEFTKKSLPGWESSSAVYIDVGLGASVGTGPRATFSSGPYRKLGSSRFGVCGSVGMLILVCNGIAVDVAGNTDVLLGDGVVNAADFGVKLGVAWLAGAKRSK